MGNRATIVFSDGAEQFSPAVYLHWSGGPGSVYAFLRELNRRRVRADQDYECARFIQIVGDYFDSGNDTLSTTSLGVSNGPTSDDPVCLDLIETDHGDNGLYLVTRSFDEESDKYTHTVRRFFEESRESEDSIGSEYGFVEVSKEDVEREREEAEKPDEVKEWAEDFQKITGGKSVGKYN